MSMVQNALYHVYPLQWFSNVAKKNHTNMRGRQDIDHLIMFTRDILPTLLWWFNLNQGMPFMQPPTQQL